MCWSQHWRAFLDLHTPGGVGQAGMIYYPCLSGGQGPDPTQLYDSWFVVLSAASWTAWCWNLSLEVLIFSSTDSPPCLGSTFPARIHGVNSLARNKVPQEWELWRLEVQNQNVRRAGCLWRCEQRSVPGLSPWLVFSLCFFTSFSFSLCMSVLGSKLPIFIRTPVISD